MIRHRKAIAVHALLLLSVVILVFPVIWMLLMSLRPIPVLFTGLGAITSSQFTLGNYAELLKNYDVPRFLLNSVLVTVIPTVLVTAASLLAAYSIARFQVRGSGIMQTLPLFAQIVPGIQIILPMYLVMLAIGLLNTYLALIVAYMALVLPFGVWMLSGYLRSVPVELEQAAMLDGCSRVGAIFRIVLPVAMPGVVATALVSFLNAWGDFLFAFTLVQGESMRLISVAVYLFLPGAQTPTAWGNLFAVSAIYMIPSLLLFALLQRLISKGVVAGAVQG